jgi:YVTN family beta-propeller protein
VIDTLTNTHVTALAVNQSVDVAFNSTGTRAYVTGQATNQVYVVDTGTYQTIKTYNVGAGPTDIKMAYGNQFLIVNNSADGTVSVIDLIQNTVNTAQVGTNPKGIAFVQ